MDRGTKQLLIIEEAINKEEIKNIALEQLNFELTTEQMKHKVISDYDFWEDIGMTIAERCKNEWNCDFKDIGAKDLVKGATWKDKYDWEQIKKSLAYEQSEAIRRHFELEKCKGCKSTFPSDELSDCSKCEKWFCDNDLQWSNEEGEQRFCHSCWGIINRAEKAKGGQE
jgi:hypothetical protein